MDKYLNFQVESAEILNDEENSEFLTASIDAFSTGESRNNTSCDFDSLRLSAPSIYEKPVLFTIDERYGDFYTHVDPEKSLIAGFVVPNSATFKENGNRMTLNVRAKIWSRYAKKFIDIFKQDGNTKKVSVEVNLLDFDKEESSGFIVMKNWIFSGICVLSDLITEASPGANIVLNFAKENKEYQDAYKKEFSMRYNDIDMSIPENVKKNVQKGLDLYKQYGIGANSVILANARFIGKNEKITAEKARQISKAFKSNKFKSMVKSPPNESYISFLLYGGSEGMSWVGELNSQLDEQDNKQLAFFGEEITFPYKKLEDINPALAGIFPSISLSQANEIARQADAIGSDDKKNGWAIAISSFKKTHVVKDGKWIKKDGEKEEMSVNDDKVEEKTQEEFAEKPEVEEEKPQFADVPAEEKADEVEEKEEGEDKEEVEEKDMSLDANLDVAAILALLGEETEGYRELTAEFAKPQTEVNYVKVCGALYSHMCKMAADAEITKKESEEKLRSYMAENEELKKFKADLEYKQFEFEVNSTFKEVEGIAIPADELAALREEAKQFSLANIDGWKNAVKAKAFSFSKVSSKKDEELRIGLPFANADGKKPKSLWG